jgi:DNA-binding SARP family transcriptional activator/TolB-like protein
MSGEGALYPSARVRLLGGFELLDPDGTPIRLVSRRTRALLGVLCIEGSGGLLRDRICGLLWGDRPDEQARGSLRQCLFELRSALGPLSDGILAAGRERISIRPGGLVSDIDQLRDGLASGERTALKEVSARLTAGPLLEGLDLSGPFQDWLDQARGAWEADLLDSLTRRIAALETEEAWEAVRTLAEAYLRRDPLQEAVAAAAIRADLASDRPSAAQRRYNAIRQALRDQLGVEPGEAIEGAIKGRRKPSSQAAPSDPGATGEASEARRSVGSSQGGVKPGLGERGGAPSVAVLPFTNLSGLREDEVFAFGMVEDIIEAISQGVEMRVISSSATARFCAGATPDLEAMTRQLGIRYALEGNVRRVGETLRVTTKLVEAAQGAVLWAARFERPLEQLAGLQEDLVLEMAAHLRTQSHRLEIERALRKPGNLTAWEAVMRAIAAYRRLSGPALMKAITEAKKAVEIAPNYGLANALLAQTQGILYNQALPDDLAGARHICDLAERAVALEPDNPVVLSTAAGAMSTTGFPERALEIADRAIQRNPNNTFAYFARGQALALLARAGEAVESFDRELQLAPDHPVLWISYLWRASALLGAGELTAAETASRAAIRLTPDNAGPRISLGMILHEMSRLDEATEAFRTGRHLEPDTTLEVWRRRYARAHPNDGAADRLDAALVRLWSLTEPLAS